MSTEQDKSIDSQNSDTAASKAKDTRPVHHHSYESEGQKIAEELGSAFGAAQTGVVNEEAAENHHHHDTFGLKVFDRVLFNLTNIAVFALSVYSTYMSNFSQPQNTPIDKQNWWMKRGNQVRSFLEKRGMSNESAKNANMILWSFLDGSIMAPVVAMIEHNRTRIGHAIDKVFRTEPADQSVYDEQPRQGWKSVLLGRLSAFSIVIPTYFLLNIKDKNDPKSLSLNNLIFDKPAEAAVKNNVAGITTTLGKRFSPEQVGGLVNSGIFETFYTTVTTTILFLVSSFAGRRDREKTERKADASQKAAVPTSQTTTDTDTDNRMQQTAAEGQFANSVGRRNIAPKEQTTSMVERYERDQAAAAQQPSTAAP